jgi:hypothetical protein
MFGDENETWSDVANVEVPTLKFRKFITNIPNKIRDLNTCYLNKNGLSFDIRVIP